MQQRKGEPHARALPQNAVTLKLCRNGKGNLPNGPAAVTLRLQ